MKLSVDILLAELTDQFDIDAFGNRKKAFHLLRPELYHGEQSHFLANHVYVTVSEYLPTEPVFDRDALIISLGGIPPKIYLSGYCMVLTIKSQVDLFTAFNCIQNIYNMYDQWEEQLFQLRNSRTSIKDIIEVSTQIIGNPIVSIDQNFHYYAYSDIIDQRGDLERFIPDEYGNIKPSILSKFLSEYNFNMESRSPYTMQSNETPFIGMNLFDGEMYIGCVLILFAVKKRRDCDVLLLQYLADHIEKATKKYLKSTKNSILSLRSALLDLLNCYPLTPSKRKSINENNAKDSFICFVIRVPNSVQKMPVDYLCSIFENEIAGSIAFEFSESVVAFVNLSTYTDSTEALMAKACELLTKLGLQAGISDCFGHLELARSYYRQAILAHSIGSTQNKDLVLYRFPDYVVDFMVSQSSGEFSPEMLLPQGLWDIFRHDIAAETSYYETLKIYMQNNMNFSQTAKDLYMHRSTLAARFEKINTLLKMDLEDPKQRLWLLLSIHLVELYGKPSLQLNGKE